MASRGGNGDRGSHPEGADSVRSELTAYVHGELSRASAQALETALQESEEMQRELIEVREVFQLFHKLPGIEPSPALERRLHHLFGSLTTEVSAEPAVASRLRVMIDSLFLFPAFLRYQLRQSARLRALAVVTAAFAIHAIVLSSLQLIDFAQRGEGADSSIVQLPRSFDPVSVEIGVPIHGDEPRDDIKGVGRFDHEDVAEPAGGGSFSEELDHPEPEFFEVAGAADTDRIPDGPNWNDKEIESRNQRTLHRLKMIARYDLEYRERALAAHGGGPATEAAVKRGLARLSSWQLDDGSFRSPTESGYEENLVGNSALALLAFIGRGSCVSYGPDQEVVAKGVSWLLDQRTADGGLGGKTRSFLYGHGLATLALVENYALKAHEPTDSLTRDVIQGAVRLIARAQNDDGGWGYLPRSQKSDVSSSVWQILALSEARRCGFRVDSKVLDRFVEFLGPLMMADGRVSYAPRAGMDSVVPVNSTRLAAATLLALLEGRLGHEKELRRAQIDAVSVAFAALPDGEDKDYHLAFFGTAAFVLCGDVPGWTEWNATLRRRLFEWQEPDGSFSPAGDPYAAPAGRVYSTAFGTLALESYYR